jgi:arylsulfatase A-like enzyme
MPRLSAQELQREIDGYDSALAYLDSQLAVLVDELNRRGVLQNTLLVITADHGESFGEHGLIGHGNSLYLEQIHVPLLVRHPDRVPADLRVPDPVSLRDIPATVLDLAGVAGDPLPGRSLAGQWQQSSPRRSSPVLSVSLAGIARHPDYPLGRRGHIRSLAVRDWQLMVHEEGTVELFRTDGDGLRDFAKTPEGRSLVRDLTGHLASILPSDDWAHFHRVAQ